MTLFRMIGWALYAVLMAVLMGLLAGSFWSLLFIIPLMVAGVVWQTRWEKSRRV